MKQFEHIKPVNRVKPVNQDKQVYQLKIPKRCNADKTGKTVKSIQQNISKLSK